MEKKKQPTKQTNKKKQRIHIACDKGRIKLFVNFMMSECSFLFLMPSSKGLSELYK